MELLTAIGLLFVGVSLGLLGGGGAILTLPILVYLMRIPAEQATTYSLFIVAMTSLFGVILKIKSNQILWKKSFEFFLVSFFGVALARRVLLPSFPSEFNFIGFGFKKDQMILLLFAATMLLASRGMLRKTKHSPDHSSLKSVTAVKDLFKSFGVGLLNGTIGAGGGFVIVPVLHLGFSLSMPQATATSLLIIFLNSLSGFLMSSAKPSMIVLLPLLIYSLIGMILGVWLSHKVPSEKLKPAFGWFVLVCGVAIGIQNFINI